MKNFLLVGVVIVLVCLRTWQYERVHVSHVPNEWFEGVTTITGIVTEDPDRGLDATKIVLGHQEIQITLPSGTEVRYGDTVSVTGKAEHPKSFITDTERLFDYPEYLSVHDTYAVMRANNVSIVSHGGSGLLGVLFDAKRHLVGTINDLLPRNEAGLFAGIIIGEKSLLPKDELKDFQVAGLTHMIVLSGFNITIVAMFLVWVLSWGGLGYRSRRVGAFVGIPLFVAMTGTGASSVRAAIMSLVVFGLQILTRSAQNSRIVFLTAAVMVFANPRILLHDPSFHMSFLAFVGLIYVSPLVEARTGRLGEWFGLRSLVVETLSVQVFVMPYILWMSGRFSLLLVIANIATIPFVSAIMGGGLVITLAGMVLYPAAALAAVPLRWALAYILWVAHAVARVDWAVVTIAPFSAWWMVGAYGILTLLIVNFHIHHVSKNK